MRPVLLAALLLIIPLTAYAHGGVDHSKKADEAPGQSSLSPASREVVVVAENPAALHPEATATRIWNGATAAGLTLLSLLYAIGLLRFGRSAAARHTLPGWRAIAFAIGIGSAALALLGPLDRWSDVLFSAHMAQHEILMLIAAPLMVAGKPFLVTLWALPATMRAHVGRVVNNGGVEMLWNRLTGPFTVLLLHAAVLWGWHIPVMYEAALRNESVHVVQHLGFFVTAALFWWALIHGRYGRLGYGIGVLYVFATAMHTQILGALLTFGSRVWYPTHAARTAAAGGRALDDQQLAGVVMWIPFGVIFLFIGLALFAAWLGEAERRVAFTTADRAAREGGA
jgi:putative membrane protein